MHTRCATGRARLGELLSLVVGSLAERGLDVSQGEDDRLARGEVHPGGQRAWHRENLTFKGVVGRKLRVRGLDVELAMYAGEVAFAEVVATAPGGAEDTQVRVADDGGLAWIHDYEASPSGPGSRRAADPASIAADVADTAARAVRCLPAAVTAGPGVAAS